tara:strand:+ start:637 stop:843 length:207 start_codon:yes stop_codon:yes gene_type:complete
LKILLLIPIALILVLSSYFFSKDNEVLYVGDNAPSFSLIDQDGNIHNLTDYKNKRLVVYFFPMADTPG